VQCGVDSACRRPGFPGDRQGGRVTTRAWKDDKSREWPRAAAAAGNIGGGGTPRAPLYDRGVGAVGFWRGRKHRSPAMVSPWAGAQGPVRAPARRHPPSSSAFFLTKKGCPLQFPVHPFSLTTPVIVSFFFCILAGWETPVLVSGVR